MGVGSIFGAAKRGLGMLGRIGKKKPIPKPKPQISKHEKFMQMDPYARATIISRRESAKRGDVWSGTSIVGTPGPHRSAKAIKKYHGPRSYQLTDPVRKRRGPKAAGGRIELKKGRLAITKADLAKSDLWRKRELKRRSKIGRKSKWDIKGGIGGHPLNPFRMHAESKALDWGSKRKDVYVRTRDDLKKSQDPNVKKVAEGFQQMDYKDKAKGTYKEKDYAPKLTKRIHGRLGRKTGGAFLPLRGTGAAGVAKAFRGPEGFKSSQAMQSRILKGKANPSRMDQAQRLKAHRLRTKIKGARAGRVKQAQQEAGTARHYAKYPGAKKLYAKQKFARQFRKAGKQ
jgi:hypothetical protein